MNYAYLLLCTLGLIGHGWANSGFSSHPRYGVNAVPYSDHSGPCCESKGRVGIHPSASSAYEVSGSSESGEDSLVSFHYGKATRSKELGCKLGLLPVSVCVSLPPNTPLKLSKHVVQRMVHSLMKDSEHNGYEPPKKPCEKPKKPCETTKHSYEEVYKKPCEHKQPCSCSVETYDPPKQVYSYGASAEVRHVPKNPKAYSYHGSGEAVYGHKKPCEHKQPCSCSAESYEQPKKTYSYPASSGESLGTKSYGHPTHSYGYPATASGEYQNKPCEHKKPCSCSAESYEKPYGYTKKPVSSSGETSYQKPTKSVYGVHGQSSAESAGYGSKKEGHGYTYNVASSVESYGPPKHAYKPPQKVLPYHHPTQKPEVPRYKSTTHAPHPTGYVKRTTVRPTTHPAPCTATHTPPSYHPYTEAPRYPSHPVVSAPVKYAPPVYNQKDNGPTYPTAPVVQKYNQYNNAGH